MRDIRPIHEGEAVTFLRLLCDAFEIDFARARSVFFNEPMFDLTRKWALFESGEMRSILTTTPLEFGWGRAIGIAGVATRAEDRGRGLAAELIGGALQQAERDEEGPALLFARDERLYSTLGFETIDESIRVPLAGAETEFAPIVELEEVRRHYQVWSSADANRLKRDEQRWKFWKWNLRVSWRSNGGYVCAEGDTIREVVAAGPSESWPVLPNSQFLGLRSVAEQLGLSNLKQIPRDAALMAYRFPAPPEFFLTDQF